MFLTGERRRKVDHSGGDDALRSRPRGSGSGSNGSTLLPLSYTSPSAASQKGHLASPPLPPPPVSPALANSFRRSPRRYQQQYYNENGAIPSPMCHNFLLGGNYFPGKDKRKRHLRKRRRGGDGIFARVSPVQMGILTVALLYIILRYPGVSWFSGIRQSRHQPAGWWWEAASSTSSSTTIISSSLELPDRSRAQADAKQLAKERDRLAEANKPLRFAALERLSPRWFHRNDKQQQSATTTNNNKNNNNNKKVKSHDKKQAVSQKEKTEPKRETTAKSDEKVVPADIQKVKSGTQGTPDAIETSEEKRKLSTDQLPQKEVAKVKEALHNEPVPGLLSSPPKHNNETLQEQLPVRTLHNMGEYSNLTACPSQLNEMEIVTTLVVQTSLNRSWVLDETCKRWTDPIVAVFALTEAESHLEISAMLSGWETKCPQLQVITHKMQPHEEDPSMYPVNHLRNIGLDHVETSHVLMVDVDFVPSDGLDTDIRNALLLRENIRKANPGATDPIDREAIVVPAFQRNTDQPCLSEDDCARHLRHNSSFIPHDFDNLRNCVKDQQCIVFQFNDNWEGHFSTRSEKWLAKEWYREEKISGTNLNDLKQISCFDSMRYEPYVVIRWCPASQDSPVVSAPFYDERFHGYGKNKIEYVQHLRFMGYQFSILPNGFIVHNPHAPSKAKEVWNDKDSNSLHKAMDSLYPKFLTELYEKFKETDMAHVVGPCRNR